MRIKGRTKDQTDRKMKARPAVEEITEIKTRFLEARPYSNCEDSIDCDDVQKLLTEIEAQAERITDLEKELDAALHRLDVIDSEF